MCSTYVKCFPNRVHSFNIILLLFLRLEVVPRVIGVVLEVLEIELGEPKVGETSFLNLRIDVVSAMLYLEDLRQKPLMQLSPVKNSRLVH